MKTTMNAPQRIQLSRKKGWRMPPNTVKVDRTTPYGNPFKVSRMVYEDNGEVQWAVELGSGVRIFKTKAEAIADSVALFEHSRVAELIRRAPGTLRGKNLACWCRPGSPCHADVLLRIANE